MINIEVVESKGHWLHILRTNDELHVNSFDDTNCHIVMLTNISKPHIDWLYDTYINGVDDLLRVEVLRYGRKANEMATLTELGFDFEGIIS